MVTNRYQDIPTSKIYLTFMIITSPDLKRLGLAVGSSTDDDDWKEWKSPAMLRERAKLFLNST